MPLSWLKLFPTHIALLYPIKIVLSRLFEIYYSQQDYTLYMQNKFAERLQEIRVENNISQNKLAELCNVQQSCISKWERGITLPDAEMIFVICRALRVSADYLLGISDY